MNLLNIINELSRNKDESRAAQMSAYMRNQFEFFGVPTPIRKQLCREYFKAAKKSKTVDWDFVNACWDNPHRELQYVAVDYLANMKAFLTPQDVPKIKAIAISKSWWDTIDGLDKIVGHIALSYHEVDETLLEWSVDQSIWIRRIAIDHQLSRKEKTNTDFLEKIIVNNFESREFFINKAIGWSLREYSKTDPEWVKKFIEKYKEKLAPLSIKEASKYI